MPSEHSRVGPSSVHRVILCPGSVAMCDMAPEREATFYSAEGSVAHLVRELCSRFGLELELFLGNKVTEDGFEIEVTEEMIDALRPGLEWIEERKGRVVNEYRVTFDRWMPGQFGTLDVGIIGPDEIVINDLKYGAGVPVSAKENEQLMTYALGFWENVARHETDATEFLLVIDQPRARSTPRKDLADDFDDDESGEEEDDGDDTPDWGGEWRVSLDELLEFGERLKTAYDLAMSPDAWLRAGEKQCQFCPAKGYCVEYARWSLVLLDLELADLDPSVITLRDKDDLTEQQRTNVALNMGRITAWTKAVYASVLQDALGGRPTPGAKCVIGKEGPRKWADEEAAEKFVRYSLLQSEAYTKPALISPAQFEKQKKKVSPEERAKVASYVTRSPGKPALVGLGDRRAGYDMADEFDDD
ncbi:DUF2800 domain-containing protein [Sulfitobacter pontiacus]